MFWVVLGGICEEGDLVERFLVVFHDLDDLGKGGVLCRATRGRRALSPTLPLSIGIRPPSRTIFKMCFD